MYDARRSAGSINQSAISLLSLCGIVAVFCAILFWPSGQDASGPRLASFQPVTIQAALPNYDTAHIEMALSAFGPETHAAAELALSETGSAAEANNVLLDQISEILLANRSSLADAPTYHFDKILSHARDTLRSASNANANWCKGHNYTHLLVPPQSADQLGRITRQISAADAELGQYVIDTSAMILTAASDTPASEFPRNSLTKQDEAILEGVVISLGTDPSLSPLFQAIQSEADIAPSLAELDICIAGQSVLSALNTIPQSTKGRLWAELVRSGKVPSALVPR